MFQEGTPDDPNRPNLRERFAQMRRKSEHQIQTARLLRSQSVSNIANLEDATDDRKALVSGFQLRDRRINSDESNRRAGMGQLGWPVHRKSFSGIPEARDCSTDSTDQADNTQQRPVGHTREDVKAETQYKKTGLSMLAASSSSPSIGCSPAKTTVPEPGRLRRYGVTQAPGPVVANHDLLSDRDSKVQSTVDMDECISGLETEDLENCDINCNVKDLVIDNVITSETPFHQSPEKVQMPLTPDKASLEQPYWPNQECNVDTSSDTVRRDVTGNSSTPSSPSNKPCDTSDIQDNSRDSRTQTVQIQTFQPIQRTLSWMAITPRVEDHRPVFSVDPLPTPPRPQGEMKRRNSTDGTGLMQSRPGPARIPMPKNPPPNRQTQTTRRREAQTTPSNRSQTIQTRRLRGNDGNGHKKQTTKGSEAPTQKEYSDALRRYSRQRTRSSSSVR